jgi:cysteine desulfurase
LGLRAASALDWARQKAADFLGCRPSEIVFTSGGTESNNLAIKGIALANPRGKHIVSARTEHSSVLESLSYLQTHHGFEITYLESDSLGNISLTDFSQAIRDDTTLVTLMTSNNETGCIHPIKTLAEYCQMRAVPIHTDAVQACGWLETRPLMLGVSAMSLSGHKFGAPKGSGLVYFKNRIQVERIMSGGGDKFERRHGTPNVAWSVALATALAALEPAQTAAARVASVTAAFIDEVLKTHPQAKLTGPPPGTDLGTLSRHPAIASFTFEGLNGETLLLELENQGVICSSGSACAAGSTDPSHVLLAMGIPEDLAQTSVRFSFSHSATIEEARTALDALAAALTKLIK